MTAPTFGFILNTIDDDPLPPILSDFSIGWMVSWSNDANPTVFPLNKPVAANSGDSATLAALGTGMMYKATLRVNAQLAKYQRSARIVYVRVLAVYKQDGTLDLVATMANALGSPSAKTGIYALLTAPQITKTTPRLGIVPGLTGITSFAITAPVVETQGSGYTHPVLTFTPAGATGTVQIDGSGKVTGVTLTSPGQYAPGTNVTAAIADSQGGTGTGATVSFDTELLANPICAALPQINTALLAHALVGGPGGTIQDALAWRQTLNSTTLIPSDAWEIVETLDGLGTEYIDGVCKELGLAIACDFEHGGYPFHAWANRPIQGALGVKRVDGFSLTDGATDGQELLAAGIGITAAGDASDAAIDDSGLISISINNASSNTLYNLYNKTRGKDFIDLALIKTIRKRLGVKNVTRKGVDAVLNDMTIVNVAIQSLDDPGIIGFKVKFVPADNTVERLRQGKFTVEDDTEIPAPITQITINRGLDRDAETVLLQQLAADGTSSNAS